MSRLNSIKTRVNTSLPRDAAPVPGELDGPSKYYAGNINRLDKLLVGYAASKPYALASGLSLGFVPDNVGLPVQANFFL